tara:strand:+ start:894 stop:1841 length:948 start_codon:yes stop_codon:yes gene_type:complete
MDKKKILIVSTGVLSAYLSQFLLKKNYQVFVTTRKIQKKYKNFSKLKIQKKINFLKLNILEKKSIEDILVSINPDIIFYFAGQSSIVKSFLNPQETLNSNYIGCKNFLTILKNKKLITKFVKANSGYIFSDLSKKTLAKSSLVKPNSPYVLAQSKAYKLVNKFRKKKVNCYTAIFFNAESSLRPENFFIRKACLFVKKNLFKKSKLLIGNINLIRDFGWAPELVKGAFYMTKLKPCNLIFASGQKISLSNILNFIFKIKKLNYKNYIKIDKKFFRKNEIQDISCNINTTIMKLKSFKWKPKIYGKKLIHKIYNNL